LESRKYDATADEGIYGTRVNKDNLGGVGSPQKEIITADGVKKYDKRSDSFPLQEYTKIIDSKWTKADGNVWYKTYGMVADGGRTKDESGRGLISLARERLFGSLTITVLELNPSLTPPIIRPQLTRMVRIIGSNTVRRNSLPSTKGAWLLTCL
jgi:hypothetical protein